MKHIIRTLLLATIVVMTLIHPRAVYANEVVENCVNRALANILQGQDISKYVAIENITRTIVGPQWKPLSNEEKQLLTDVVYKVMSARIVEKGKEYVGIKVSGIKIDPSEKYAGKVEISGHIGVYFFETTAMISKKKCYFYTLSIEGMFKLHSWLGDQPEIQSTMKGLKLKF